MKKNIQKNMNGFLLDGDTATVGITKHATEMLGDIVFVEACQKKENQLNKDEKAAVVESTKAASDVYSPVSGEIIRSKSTNC